MSPDQYAFTKELKAQLKRAEGFQKMFPNFAEYMLMYIADFRGITMFIGDNAEYVVGFRIFDGDGAPVVCWGSGTDPFSALINTDIRVGQGSFRPDPPKKAAKSK